MGRVFLRKDGASEVDKSDIYLPEASATVAAVCLLRFVALQNRRREVTEAKSRN